MRKLHVRVDFDLLDGERRVYRLHEFNRRYCTDIVPHEFSSCFTDKVNQLVGSIQIEMVYWKQIEGWIQALKTRLEGNEFIVERVRVMFPTRLSVFFREQGQVPIYVFGQQVVSLPQPKMAGFLKVCEDHGLIVVRNSILGNLYVSKRFPYNGSDFTAKVQFTDILNELAQVGMATPTDLGLNCVIRDDNEERDNLWLPSAPR